MDLSKAFDTSDHTTYIVTRCQNKLFTHPIILQKDASDTKLLLFLMIPLREDWIKYILDISCFSSYLKTYPLSLNDRSCPIRSCFVSRDWSLPRSRILLINLLQNYLRHRLAITPLYIILLQIHLRYTKH